MEQLLVQIGVGGTLTILILREVFGFLRSRNGKVTTNSDTAGYTPVDGERDETRDRLTKLESSDKTQWRKLDEISKTQKEHTTILIRIDERTKKLNGD